MADLQRVEAYEPLSADTVNSYAEEIERLSTSMFGSTTTAAKPILKVKLDSDITTTSGSGDWIAWDVASQDPEGMWDPQEPTRITIRTPGVWLCMVQARYDYVNETGIRGLYITLNGSDGANGTTGWERPPSTSSAAGDIIPLTSFDTFAEGDYLELRQFQDSGEPIDILSSGYGGTYFSAVYLGPSE